MIYGETAQFLTGTDEGVQHSESPDGLVSRDLSLHLQCDESRRFWFWISRCYMSEQKGKKRYYSEVWSTIASTARVVFSFFVKNSNVASSLVVIHWRIVYVTTSHSTHYTCMQCHRSLVPLTQQEKHRRYTRLRTYVRTKTTYVLLSPDVYVLMYVLLFQPATSS